MDTRVFRLKLGGFSAYCTGRCRNITYYLAVETGIQTVLAGAVRSKLMVLTEGDETGGEFEKIYSFRPAYRP
jgi:hypothetical protein